MMIPDPNRISGRGPSLLRTGCVHDEERCNRLLVARQRKEYVCVRGTGFGNSSVVVIGGARQYRGVAGSPK
jgi:hypothetical protein